MCVVLKFSSLSLRIEWDFKACEIYELIVWVLSLAMDFTQVAVVR